MIECDFGRRKRRERGVKGKRVGREEQEAQRRWGREREAEGKKNFKNELLSFLALSIPLLS